MKKLNLSTKIFLDGAVPEESKKTKEILGFLDGQTTNPTLLARNPEIQKRVESDKKFSEKELYSFYKKAVIEISEIANGPISIEVYADKNTQAEEMLSQAREMIKWIPQAYIKLPIIKQGLKAAHLAVQENIPVNMTLCFSQEQAAAVYTATKGAKKPVFVSPFVGRLDDRKENGMSLIENILRMYQKGDGHVQTLGASIRNLDHFLFALKIGCPLVTVPFKIIEEWAKKNFILPGKDWQYKPDNLKPISHQEISLTKNWQDYNIYHPLTEAGIERFCLDWKAVIKQ